MPNLALPGNPRYQPKDLIEVFGYDNLYRVLIEVILATLRTLAEIGVISPGEISLLTPEVEAKLFTITTSEVDKIEREITRHDIRALVRRIQELLPPPLRRWVHVLLTSYDVIDTARVLQFVRVHEMVLRPKTHAVIKIFREKALQYADQVQIGRTHGQHALPITVGFWFATILNRVLFNFRQMDEYANALVGKISGAVGAYNAQVALGVARRGNIVFEDRVLEWLGLRPAPISTQILQPEPLAYYLFSCHMLSAVFGQFGRDGRHLMRTEIAELTEPFAVEDGQVGSSTMAHKRNPITFENLEGTHIKSTAEFLKVLMTMISEHQRDLVGSCVSRDFPTLIVNVTSQLDALLRPNKNGEPFLDRLVVDTEACKRNLAMEGDKILAEPFYLLLQMYGYRGDAHKLINEKAIPMVGKQASTLLDAVERLARVDHEIARAWERVPEDLLESLRDPGNYTGNATQKVHQICKAAEIYLARA